MSLLQAVMYGSAAIGWWKIITWVLRLLRSRYSTRPFPSSLETTPNQLDKLSFRSKAHGLLIHYAVYRAMGEEKAYLYLFHGYKEYHGRYRHVIERLNREGYTVFSMDMVGHGKSEGDRGYVSDFQHYVEDCKQLIGEVTPSYRTRNLPTFIYAHSFGSLVSLSALLEMDQSQFKGFACTGPAVKISDDMASPTMQFFSSMLSSTLPRLPVQNLSDQVSRNPVVVEQYRRDPLVARGPITARWGNETINATKRLTARLPEIKLPLYVIHGEQDVLVTVDAAHHLYENIGSTDKTKNIIDGGYHEVLNDTQAEHALGKIVGWLEARRN
eukprot:gb/GECG01007659.1/.p1 GENE.gb/GECG01007659.1/~~gb/GECG01007659.1/.p1  ORF type:complete len:327 (+),score=26.57 gb/GECG01007659.1/:1-981(+)